MRHDGDFIRAFLAGGGAEAAAAAAADAAPAAPTAAPGQVHRAQLASERCFEPAVERGTIPHGAISAPRGGVPLDFTVECFTAARVAAMFESVLEGLPQPRAQRLPEHRPKRLAQPLAHITPPRVQLRLRGGCFTRGIRTLEALEVDWSPRCTVGYVPARVRKTMECQVTGCTTITWGARGSPRAMDVQRWRCHVPTEITPLFGLHGANRHDKLRRASEAGAGDEVQLGTWRGGAAPPPLGRLFILVNS